MHSVYVSIYACMHMRADAMCVNIRMCMLTPYLMHTICCTTKHLLLHGIKVQLTQHLTTCLW